MTVGIVKPGGPGDATAAQRLLEGALSLLAERGYAAMELRDVAERGHAPRGSIYHHFPGGKSQLAAAAAALEGERVRETIERSLAERGLRETLPMFGELFRRRAAEPPRPDRLPRRGRRARAARGPGARGRRDRRLPQLGGRDRESAARRGRRPEAGETVRRRSSSRRSRARSCAPAPPATTRRSTTRSPASPRRSTHCWARSRAAHVPLSRAGGRPA